MAPRLPSAQVRKRPACGTRRSHEYPDDPRSTHPGPAGGLRGPAPAARPRRRAPAAGRAQRPPGGQARRRERVRAQPHPGGGGGPGLLQAAPGGAGAPGRAGEARQPTPARRPAPQPDPHPRPDGARHLHQLRQHRAAGGLLQEDLPPQPRPLRAVRQPRAEDGHPHLPLARRRQPRERAGHVGRGRGGVGLRAPQDLPPHRGGPAALRRRRQLREHRGERGQPLRQVVRGHLRPALLRRLQPQRPPHRVPLPRPPQPRQPAPGRARPRGLRPGARAVRHRHRAADGGLVQGPARRRAGGGLRRGPQGRRRPRRGHDARGGLAAGHGPLGGVTPS